MWLWMSMMLADAEARDLQTWVRPEYGDVAVICRGTLAIAPDGSVTLRALEVDQETLERVAQQRSDYTLREEALDDAGRKAAYDALARRDNVQDLTEDLAERLVDLHETAKLRAINCEHDMARTMIDEAVTQWRFEPAEAPSALLVDFVHLPDWPGLLGRRTSLEHVAPDAASCVILIQDGKAIRKSVRVTGCPPKAAKAVKAAVEADWTFDTPKEGIERGQYGAVDPMGRRLGESAPAQSGGQPIQEHCLVHATINERGKPGDIETSSCEPAVARKAKRAMKRMRFAPSAAPWAFVTNEF